MSAHGPFDVDEFRNEVRAFCRREFPASLAEKARLHIYFSKEDRVHWQRILQSRGWFAAHWPAAYGGADWEPLQRFILIEELELAGTPWLTHFGVSFAGPLIYTCGSDAQKAKFLPGILHSDTWWCQGFSEPGAGSDLAAVRTRAILQGDHYIVSGQKTWCTMAHWADMMFALVRTSDSGRPHSGLTMLLIDLQSPGVTVRPIATVDGGHHINDVFFDQVKVPVANRVGGEGEGWKCTKLIVGNERPLVTELGKAKRLFNLLRELGASEVGIQMQRQTPSHWRRQQVELEIQLATLEALAYSVFDSSTPDHVSASMLKMRGSQMQQGLFDAIIDMLGYGGLPFEPGTLDGEASNCLNGTELASRLTFEHLYSRATSIYGGSNEIQLHIIAKAIFES